MYFIDIRNSLPILKTCSLASDIVENLSISKNTLLFTEVVDSAGKDYIVQNSLVFSNLIEARTFYRQLLVVLTGDCYKKIKVIREIIGLIDMDTLEVS